MNNQNSNNDEDNTAARKMHKTPNTKMLPMSNYECYTTYIKEKMHSKWIWSNPNTICHKWE